MEEPIVANPPYEHRAIPLKQFAQVVVAETLQPLSAYVVAHGGAKIWNMPVWMIPSWKIRGKIERPELSRQLRRRASAFLMGNHSFVPRSVRWTALSIFRPTPSLHVQEPNCRHPGQSIFKCLENISSVLSRDKRVLHFECKFRRARPVSHNALKFKKTAEDWRRGSESNRPTRICSPLTRQENQCLSEFATLFLCGRAYSVTNIS
jgi:hypothetical protein